MGNPAAPVLHDLADGTPRQQAFAAIHCTAGDFLIATTTLVLALVTVGYRDWPMSHFKRVAAIASALGLGYAIFSEWLNISVRGTWSYLALMPVVICWVESGLIAAAPMEHCPDSVLRRDATLHTTAAQ